MNAQTVENPQKATCAFCDLALPSKPVKGRDGRLYCCAGCAHVDEIVDVVGSDSDRGRQVVEAARYNSLLSTPDIDEAPHDLDESLREEVRLHIKDLACPSCAWLVERVLKKTDGVARAQVDYYSDSAQVEFDLSSCSLESLVEAVKDTGYTAEEYSLKGSGANTKDMIRLGLAFAIAMNQMILAWVGYDVVFPGGEGGFEPIVAWIQLLSALPVVVWSALPLYKRAIGALKRGSVVMETLLSLGIISSMVISVSAFISHHEHLYFESATMLVALSLAGRYFENWIKHKTSASLTQILEFSPKKARIAATGRFEAIEAINTGTELAYQKGETIALDMILRENAVVREGLLTGESHAVSKSRGAMVLAGSVVESETLLGTVYREAKASVAEIIKERVMTALRRVDSGSRLADRLAQGFVPLVIIVALVSFLLHWTGGAAVDRAALIAVSVLVVSCPCAFGIAASSALSLAVLTLAKLNVLIKEPQVLEHAINIDEIYFDKTGTLTAGALQIENIGWIEEEILNALEIIQSIERESRHPIGLALAALLPEDRTVQAENVIEVVGMGITGTVNNKRYAVGKSEMFEDVNRPLPSRPANASRVWFGLAGEVPSGYLDLADTLKPEANDVIRAVHERGISTGLLSGDGSEITTTIAGLLNIQTAQGDLKPEDKAAFIAERRALGKTVAFVGDGFNDAPGLAEADVGVAMSSGADLAMISAPVALTRSDLRGLLLFLKAARRSRSVLVSNFTWAFIYNLAMIPVAALGLLLPIHAALLMALSSASVALNSVRVKKGFQAGEQNLEKERAI